MLGLLNDGESRRSLAESPVAVPHLVDAEVANALRAQVTRGTITEHDGASALTTWARLGVSRFPGVGLVDRVWELRANLSAYDATYVALAESLECALVTADARLARAPGLRCPVTVVPT